MTSNTRGLHFAAYSDGTGIDRAGALGTPTVTGAVPRDGKIGGGVFFDGVDDVHTFGSPNVIPCAGAYTVSLWIQMLTVTAGAYNYIMGSSGPSGLADFRGVFLIKKDGTNNFWVSMYFDAGGSQNMFLKADFVPVVGTWYHLAWTQDGTTTTGRYLYCNGVLSTTASASLNPQTGMTPANNFRVTRDASNTYVANCVINRLHVWNRVLSVQEIRADMEGFDGV